MTGILDNTLFQSRLEQVARSAGISISEARAKAARNLEEMRGVRRPLALRLFAALSRFVYRRGYHHHPVYDLREVERVRKESQARSTVFLVTHKTYLDFFVLFDFLYRQGIPTPYIFGGLNMKFAGFGSLARRAGGIFIRRTFKDDEIYKLVLRRYIASLIEDRASFMWAIEGTRSRTGKLVRPRLGLLNYVYEVSKDYDDDAISYLPVSVVYDQIPDVVDMAAQEQGAEKKPEDLAWFMKYVGRMGNQFGYIHLRFGKAQRLTKTPSAPDFGSSVKLAGGGHIELHKLAFEVCYRINEITPATMTALILMVLLCRGRCDAWQIQYDVTVLMNYIRRSAKRAFVKRPSRVLSADSTEALDSLLATGVVRAKGAGPHSLFKIVPGKVSEAIYYSNMAVHHFVISAFTELALIIWARSPAAGNRALLWAEYRRLRNLFKFEFFFARNEIFQDQLRRELDFLHPDWRSVLELGGEAVISLLKQKPLLVASGVLSPYVSAYRLVGDIISQSAANRRLPDAALIAKCLDSRPDREDDGSRSVPGVSRALLVSGLRVADNLGLRNDGHSQAIVKRAEFLEELEFTAWALDELDSIAQSSTGRS